MMQVPKPFDFETSSFGCWLKVPSPSTAELAAQAGFDYLCIDMQHGMADRSDVLNMLYAIQPYSQRTLVRVPTNELSVIGWVLDMGATGVIVPLVNSATEAEAAVRASRYPPDGDRSMGPTRAIRIFGEACVEQTGAAIQCIPMIETCTALDNLDDILAVTGVDVIYVGPSDLSVSLGLGRGNNDGEPAFDEALAVILSACRRHGVVPGIHAIGPNLPLRRIEQGFRVMSVIDDDGAMLQGFGAALEGLGR
ncbi:MAG: aldolase/citrate lyase family protein [Actinomycetota bacterium]|nr:aldolase/citrate lyase family protein [Actinomycetota bacterium]